MRAKDILLRLCETCRDVVHAARLRAVVDAVDALMTSERATLTALGRVIAKRTQPRHGIKRMDRLLSNPKLQRELTVWFRALAQFVLGREKHAIVLLDWTQLNDELWSLAATVPFEGRSIPLLARAFKKHQVGNPAIHEGFLRQLRGVLPADCKAVIVADGGFRPRFFSTCLDLGFDYVIRVRREGGVAYVEGERIPVEVLYQRASDEAQCLGGGSGYAASKHGQGGRLILAPKPRTAHRRERVKGDYERRRAAEPWLLQTSFDNEPAALIVDIYAKRMQIEETFRDAKNPRFGWSLAHARTLTPKRFDVLLVLVAFAHAVLVMFGAALVRIGVERKLRASSTNKRVLSFFSVGSLAARLRLRVAAGFRALHAELRRLRELQRSAFPRITFPRPGGEPIGYVPDHVLFCCDCGWRGDEWGWPPI